jgi:hypothetical protein
MATQQQDFLAQERDAKFKAWLQKKSIRDKAFEVFKVVESKILNAFNIFISIINAWVLVHRQIRFLAS